MSTSISTVAFHGANLPIISINGNPYFAPRAVCEAVGVDWSAQLQKIKQDIVLNSVVVLSPMTGSDGKQYEMVCLPLEYLNGWLFKINPTRVTKLDVRERLVQYQRECYPALNNYWNGKAEQASYTGDLKVPLAGSAAQYVKDYAKRHIKDYGEAVKRGQPNIVPDEIPLEVLQGIVVGQMRQFRMFTWFDSDQMKLCHQVIGRNETVIDLNDEKKVRCMILDGISTSMYPMILRTISDHYTELAKVKRRANDMPVCATPVTRGLI